MSFLKKPARISESLLSCLSLPIRNGFLLLILLAPEDNPETHLSKAALKISLTKMNIFLQVYQIYKHRTCDYRFQMIKRKSLL